ncbi:hypothetical protein [Thioalkalivibrio sp.]|uniref:hypothetical protein n=1 Tax=Thioalkalivibrio sp. TaxID=2093813 RepID=UPI0012D5B1E1|nr:hypothetical protein [Thioalkalivibrio sp.]TVP82133.1 MAG: hypothetical protein EA346_03405 [Thioalkalivibrio sp.]
MNRIVLHIGSTKTGTSSLQKFLTRYAKQLLEQGVVYPVAGRRAAGQIAHHNLYYEKHGVRVATGVFKPEVGVWKEALKEIDAVSDAVGVISSEAFMNCPSRQIARFQKELDGRHVTVLAYVRRQDLWMQSAWNQQARFGRCSLDFWDFFTKNRARGHGDYVGQLTRWAQAFGWDHLVVQNFDSLPSGGIVPDFFASVLSGVRVAANEHDDFRGNTKAGVKQLVAVSNVLKDCRAQLGATFELPSTAAIRIAQYFRKRPGEVTDYSVLSFNDACEIQRSFEESNDHLSRLSPSFRASGGFRPPSPEEYRNRLDFLKIGDDVLTKEERRFVQRMTREIVRANKKLRVFGHLRRSIVLFLRRGLLVQARAR